MPIETLDDIVEQVADWVGAYGAHDDAEKKDCRCCFTQSLRARIESAAEIQSILKASR